MSVFRKFSVRIVPVGYLALLAILFLTSSELFSQMERDVIYGEDDRIEAHRSDDAVLLASSRAVAILVGRNEVERVGEHSYRLETTPAYREWNLCPSERFREQPAIGDCTGFLVADDLLITAGHCFQESYACRETAIVFDYTYVAGVADGGDPTLVDGANLYYCQEVVHRLYDIGSGIDFAIMRLDRQVVDRAPLRLRKEGKVKRGDPLTVISHPLGLPLKISAQAEVRANKHKNYFVANTDTYTGSSGAPVLNSHTGLVEGMIVRGEDDFQTTDDDCVVSRICNDTSCRGEDVLRATVFGQWLP